jgi:hypothetical protein
MFRADGLCLPWRATGTGCITKQIKCRLLCVCQPHPARPSKAEITSFRVEITVGLCISMLTVPLILSFQWMNQCLWNLICICVCIYNRNEYPKVSAVKRGRRVWLATLPPSVSQLPGQCEILDISQPYRPPWPVTGIALLFLVLYSLCVMCPL